MSDEPHDPVSHADLVVRDYLAAVRTTLANERTLLAYIRTALALTAAGAFFVKFSTTLVANLIGWGLIPLGLAVLTVGLRQFHKMKANIDDAQRTAAKLHVMEDKIGR